METINEEFYKNKLKFFERRQEVIAKIFSHGPSRQPFLRHLNLNFNPENYKCKPFENNF